MLFGRASRRVRAAGAGVDGGVVAFAHGALQAEGGFDVLARAGAGVGHVLGNQPIQGVAVQMETRALPHGRFIGQQSASGQLLQDELVRTGHAAGRVHVFDAHQPLPAMGAGVQPAGQCSKQRARMQRARGGGGKAPSVSHIQCAGVKQLSVRVPGRRQTRLPRGGLCTSHHTRRCQTCCPTKSSRPRALRFWHRASDALARGRVRHGCR